MMSQALASSFNQVANNPTELAQRLDQLNKHETVRLGEFLLHENLVSTDVLKQAIAIQHDSPQKKIGQILIDMGALTPFQAQEAAIAKLELPRVNLAEFNVERMAVALLPREVAQRCHLMPLMLHRGNLVIAVHGLPDPETLDLVRFAAKHPLELVLASRDEIDKAILANFHAWNEMHELAKLPVSEYAPHQEDQMWQEAEFLAQKQPIVRLVNSLLADAVGQRASDIHIRPGPRAFEVLFRVDGSLIPVQQFEKSYLPPVISRIKILARLNIAERRQPQDGRIPYQMEGMQIDLRVSIIPVQYGESVVIRILNKSVGLRSIGEIGFKPDDEANFRDLLKRSYGILLVTGPTGSGKTTTLYAAMQEIRHDDNNIVTVEDPIEYELDHVRQIQLLPAINFGFPDALRHILRHDPDVIMIGEMRDTETSKIAVESALTGHLVLSTLHTNDAPSALVRLVEIGVEPYMIRSAVIGVLAQRLVRCNCPHCRTEENVDPLMRKNLGLSETEKFYRSGGCRHCRDTGFQGRMAIYELMTMNDELRNLINHHTATGEYRAAALRAGMVSLPMHGVEQARTGKVSIAEVYRACM